MVWSVAPEGNLCRYEENMQTRQNAECFTLKNKPRMILCEMTVLPMSHRATPKAFIPVYKSTFLLFVYIWHDIWFHFLILEHDFERHFIFSDTHITSQEDVWRFSSAYHGPQPPGKM